MARRSSDGCQTIVVKPNIAWESKASIGTQVHFSHCLFRVVFHKPFGIGSNGFAEQHVFQLQVFG